MSLGIVVAMDLIANIEDLCATRSLDGPLPWGQQVEDGMVGERSSPRFCAKSNGKGTKRGEVTFLLGMTFDSALSHHSITAVWPDSPDQ